MPAKESWAILVGVQRYSDERLNLKYTERDTRSLRRALTQVARFPMSNISVLSTDRRDSNFLPTRANLLSQVNRVMRQLKPGDTFLFYFSGHGCTIGNEHYLLTADTNINNEALIRHTAFPFNILKQSIPQASASQVIFILDACRDTPKVGKGFGWVFNLGSLEKAFKESVGSISPRKKSAVAVFACKNGQKAYEHDEAKMSAFTHFLIEGFNAKANKGSNASKIVSIEELGQYARWQVSKWAKKTNKDQEPQVVPVSGKVTLTLQPTNLRGAKSVDNSPFVEVEVKTAPKDSQLYVDNELSDFQDLIEVDLGSEDTRKIILRVEKEGHYPREVEITVKRGVSLKPIIVSLRVKKSDARQEANEFYQDATGLERAGNLTEAKELYEFVIKNPATEKRTLVGALMGLGRIMYDPSYNQIGEAKQYFNRVLQLDKDNPQAHYWLGLIFSRVDKDYHSAAGQFRLAIDTGKHQSNICDFYSELAICLNHLGRRSEARQLLREAIEKHNCNPLQHPIFQELGVSTNK